MSIELDAARDKALDDLEAALADIEGAADVLMTMGQAASVDANAVGYLGGRLCDHYRAAHDALCHLSGRGAQATPARQQAEKGGEA